MGLRIGIIGTGEMGRPLVDRLRSAGHLVAAYARRSEVRDELAAADVEVAGDPAALAAGRDVVLLYVYADEQVLELGLEGGVVDAMDPGSLLVVSTTGSPGTVETLAGRAAPRGIGVVDAPGSGGPDQVARGDLTLFVGGSDDDVHRAMPVFEAYASTISHVGPLGAGQKVKLLNNLLFGAHVELAVEAARLCGELGLDEAQVASALHGCSGASAALDMAAAMGSADELMRLAGRFVHKDVVVARRLAAQLGVDLGSLTAPTDRVLERTSPE